MQNVGFYPFRHLRMLEFFVCTLSMLAFIRAGFFVCTFIIWDFGIEPIFIYVFNHSMSGVILLSFADYSNMKFQYEGIIWSLISAIGYAVYLVNLRRKVQNENQMSLAMFFGFVGLWTIVCLWPGLLILEWTKYEHFEWPNKIQLGFLLLNGFLGTLGAELLWLWGCFLTSSITATLSLGLTIPLSMIADYFIKNKVYDWKFYVGSIPILFSFICIAYLTSDEEKLRDPVGYLLRKIFCKVHDTAIYEPLDGTDSEDELDDENTIISSSLSTKTHSNTDNLQNSHEESENSLLTGLSNLFYNGLINHTLKQTQIKTNSNKNSDDRNLLINSINNDSKN